MTRKDYIALAGALRIATEVVSDQGFDDRTFPAYIADVLQADNSRFDRARFLAACGVES